MLLAGTHLYCIPLVRLVTYCCVVYVESEKSVLALASNFLSQKPSAFNCTISLTLAIVLPQAEAVFGSVSADGGGVSSDALVSVSEADLLSEFTGLPIDSVSKYLVQTEAPVG